MDLREPRKRVNASMLPSFQGMPVVLLGMGSVVDPSGMSFQLKSCDGQTVTVKVQEPIQEYIYGLVEVHGIVNHDNSIGAEQYIMLADQQTAQTFDMGQYNKAIQLMQQASEHYIMGAPEQ